MTSLLTSPRPASSTSYSPAPPAPASSASSTTSTEQTPGTGSSTSTSTKGPPSNEDIEAVIKMATSTRPTPDGRPPPGKDTRTQLFVGNLPYRVRWQDLKDLFRKAGTVLRADVSLGPDNRSRGYGTVLLATAEDAGRAVDMFDGYSWQTRTLEVRLDRLSQDLDPTLHAPHPLAAAYAHNTLQGMGLMPGMGIGIGGVGAPLTVGMGTGSGSTSGSGFPGLNHPISPLNRLSFMPSQPHLHRQFQSDSVLSTNSGMLSVPNPLGLGSNDQLFDLGDRKTLFVGNLPFHCQWQDLKDLFRQAGSVLRADVCLGPDGRSRGFGTVSFATEADAERAVQVFNGYEYSGRTLKVHADKFAQPVNSTLPLASFPLSNSASPQPQFLHANSQHVPSSFSSHTQQLASPASSSFSSTQNTSSNAAFSGSSPLGHAWGLDRRSGFGSAAASSPPSPFPSLGLPLGVDDVASGTATTSFARAVSPRLRGLAGKSSQAGVSTSLLLSSGNGASPASQMSSLAQSHTTTPAATAQTQLKKMNSALTSALGTAGSASPALTSATTTAASSSSNRVSSSSATSSASVSSTNLPLQMASANSSSVVGSGLNASINSTSNPGLSGGGGRSVKSSASAASTSANFVPSSSSELSNTSSVSSGRVDGPSTGSTRKSRPPPVSLINSNATNNSGGSGSGSGERVSPRAQNQCQNSSTMNLPQQQHQSPHPAHPGPISLPPPPPASAFPGLSEPIQLTPGGTGIVGISPLYGPGYGHALVHHVNGQISPLATPGHPYHGHSYAYHPLAGHGHGHGHGHSHGHVAMTPHGLPPITPSMPSFTFIPQPSPSGTGNGGVGRGGRMGSLALSMMGTSPSSAGTSGPSSAIGGYSTFGSGGGGSDVNSNPRGPDAGGVGSGGMNLNLNIAGGMGVMSPLTQHVMGAFSPGSTMSPGAPWGRPGTMLAPPGAVGVVGGPPPGSTTTTGQQNDAYLMNPAVGVGMQGSLYGVSTPPGVVQASESLGYFPPVPFMGYHQQQPQQQQEQGAQMYATSSSTQGDVGYFPLVPPQPSKDQYQQHQQQYAPSRKSNLADELIMNTNEDGISGGSGGGDRTRRGPPFLDERHRSSSGGSGPSESEAGTDLGLGGGFESSASGRRGTSSIATSWKSGSDDGLGAAGAGVGVGVIPANMSVRDVEVGFGALDISSEKWDGLKTQQTQSQLQRSQSASSRNRQSGSVSQSQSQSHPQPPTLTHKNKSDPDQSVSGTTSGTRTVSSGNNSSGTSAAVRGAIPWATIVASGRSDAGHSSSR